MESKRKHPRIKTELHPRSQHLERYNFKELIKSLPELEIFVNPNKYGDDSINFFDPKAVLALNKALLKYHYDVGFWEIPEHYLCPPIPGRADYIHNIADLLTESNGKIPKGPRVKGLDIGIGASCIYPIIGNYEYGWSFIGSDINTTAIASAKTIVDRNQALNSNVDIRFQERPNSFLKDILRSDETIDFTICNPPFHKSLRDAQMSNLKKLKHLKGSGIKTSNPNFGGQESELWTKGGEARFIKDLIYESRNFSNQCLWFTSLISKESTLRPINRILKKVGAIQVKTIKMGQGQKRSRFIAWTFLSENAHGQWSLKKR